jgi:hypothetical protein
MLVLDGTQICCHFGTYAKPARHANMEYVGYPRIEWMPRGVNGPAKSQLEMLSEYTAALLVRASLPIQTTHGPITRVRAQQLNLQKPWRGPARTSERPICQGREARTFVTRGSQVQLNFVSTSEFGTSLH